MEKDKIGCFLQISEFDCAPEEITSLFELQPTEVYRKGEVKRKDPRGIHPDVLFDTNIWILESDLSSDRSEEEHLDAVLKCLDRKDDVIKHLAEKYNVHIEIYGKKYHPHIGVFVKDSKVRRLANMGVSLGVSIYAFEPTYLDNADKVNNMTQLVKSALSLSQPRSFDIDAESRVIADVLAVIEDQADELNSLMASLVDEDTDDEERADLLADIRNKTQNIKKAIEESRYLS